MIAEVEIRPDVSFLFLYCLDLKRVLLNQQNVLVVRIRVLLDSDNVKFLVFDVLFFDGQISENYFISSLEKSAKSLVLV